MLRQSILFFMGLALIPTTVFSYGFLFVQKPHSADGRCTGYTDRPQFILGSKWAFALFNLVSTFLTFCEPYYITILGLRLAGLCSKLRQTSGGHTSQAWVLIAASTITVTRTNKLTSSPVDLRHFTASCCLSMRHMTNVSSSSR